MTVDQILREVAAHGLAGHRDDPVVVEPGAGGTIVAGAASHKLVGLLDQALADGALHCDATTATAIGDRAVEVAGWNVRLERHMLAVHELLRAAEVPHRFVKGATVAHRFYDHAGLRMSVDVDVLVHEPSLDASLAALASADHVRLQADPYRGFSRRYAKSVTMRHTSGVEVDVHRVIPDGPFGLRGPASAVWDRAEAAVAIGGHPLPTLEPPDAFVQAAVNAVASYDQVALASLRDVAQVGSAIADRADEAEALARELGVRACLAEAVGLAARVLRWEPPGAIDEMARWPMTDLERRWLDSYRQPPSDRRRAWLGVQAVPGVLPKAAYAANVAALWASRPARRRARRRGAS
jgi:hypothetical protein